MVPCHSSIALQSLVASPQLGEGEPHPGFRPCELPTGNSHTWRHPTTVSLGDYSEKQRYSQGREVLVGGCFGEMWERTVLEAATHFPEHEVDMRHIVGFLTGFGTNFVDALQEVGGSI